MTKSEFIDWKRHPVTQQVFSQLEQRVGDLVEALIEDPRPDLAAAIKAYRDLLNIDFEETL